MPASVTEIWVAIPGYEGVYEVSDLGRVRRVAPADNSWPGRILKQSRRSSGHLRVNLCKNGRVSRCAVHRLVAVAFHGYPVSPRVFARHLNDVPDDNRASNIAWGTHKDNVDDAVRNGKLASGEKNGFSRLTEHEVDAIRTASDRGDRQVDIAARFGVTQSTISKVVLRHTWHKQGAETCPVA